MRLITTLIAICFIISNSIASDTTITFIQISYEEVIAQAKLEQKPVFIYFHFDGCGACVTMERTAFVDKGVANFHNENFICLEVNTLKGEGIETNKIFNVRTHPTFIYLDQNGNILHKIVGVYSPEEFVGQAQDALNPQQNLTVFQERYQEGNREADFLFEYCYKQRNAYGLDSLIINEYLKTQSLEELEQERNIKFIYEFALHNLQVTMPFESRAYQFLFNNKEKFTKYFDADQVDTRIVWILHNKVYEAIENQDEALFDKTTKLLSEYDNGKLYYLDAIDGRTVGVITSKNLVLTSKIAYYEKSGDIQNHKKYLNQHIEKIWDDSSALNQMAWSYYLNYDDIDYLKLAKKMAVRAIELNNNYASNDTYAALLYKTGKYEDALRQAQIAISIAEKKGERYHETTELIEKIKGAMKN